MQFHTLLRFFFPSLTWKIKTKEKVLFLTFDDGPIPEVTPWVLEQLEKYKAKATFFCIGDNVLKHPDVFNEIVKQGHAVGNHTFNHLNAWKSNSSFYLHNIKDADDIINSKLFRPPYGKLTPSLINNIKKNYKIIMWDVLTYDFDEKMHVVDCFKSVKQCAGTGSIVVFHDSIKAKERLVYALPETLKYFTNKGFRFEALTAAHLK